MSSVSETMHIDKLDSIVNKYDSKIEMKPVDVKLNT